MLIIFIAMYFCLLSPPLLCELCFQIYSAFVRVGQIFSSTSACLNWDTIGAKLGQMGAERH